MGVRASQINGKSLGCLLNVSGLTKLKLCITSPLCCKGTSGSLQKVPVIPSACWMLFIRHVMSISLTHWGRDKMAAVSQTTLSNAFSWMKMLEFRLRFQINNYPALVQIMAWRRSGDKPLSEPMMVSLLTHICVTRPQWVKWRSGSQFFNEWSQ